jgi:hypothetical protein
VKASTVKAAFIGQRVLAGFNKGREKANAHKRARTAENLITIAEFLSKDITNGYAVWGRIGRLARRTGFSEGYIRKMLARLYCRVEFSRYAPPKTTGVHYEKRITRS